MEKMDYKTVLEFIGKYDEEATRVFNKLQDADLKAETGILHYGYYSEFERIEWEYSDEYSIGVRYYNIGYDSYESTALIMPVDILFDDAKIDEWIKSKIDEALEKQEQKRKSIEKRQEEKERQEYERLKEKFGK